MSNSAGPKITKDGLVLDFDAANTKSYNFYADPYASNVSLHLNGENLVDLSTAAKTITNNNVLVSDAQSKYQNSSLYFLRTNPSYLSVANHADLNISTGDWTVEFWVYPVSFSSLDTFVSLNTGTTTNGFTQLRIDVASNGAMYMLCASAVSTWISIATSAIGTLSTGSWQHIAAVRSGNNFTLYVNGISKLTYTSASSLYNFSGPTIIGAVIANTSTVYDPITSYIDNLKITKGVARYTSTFTSPPIPSTCTDLTKNKNVGTLTNGVDYNFSNGGSLVFDGVNDYVNIPASTNLTFGTGDFTMECWFKTRAKTTLSPTLLGINLPWASNVWNLIDRHVNNSTKLTFWCYNYNTSAAMLISNTSISNATWYQVVVTRISNTWSIYVNGSLESTVTSSVSLDGGVSRSINLGVESVTDPAWYDGNISKTRIYKGKGLTSGEVYNNFVANRGRFGVYSHATLPVSGAALWLDASQQSTLFTDAGTTPVTTSGQSIYQWNDLSGNNRHAVQATSGNRPTWLPPASGQNGLGVTSFNGSSSFFDTSMSLNGLSSFSIFLVAKSATSGGWQSALRQQSGYQGYFVMPWTSNGGAVSPRIILAYDGGTTTTNTVTLTNGVFNLISFIRTSGTSNVANVGGSLSSTRSANSASLSESVNLSIGRYPQPIAEYFSGSIAEIVIFNRALSASETASVESYLKTKWGTP